jgi:hypothetical protein
MIARLFHPFVNGPVFNGSVFYGPVFNGPWLLLSILLFFAGCKSSEYKAYVYDPVGATLTEDKPLDAYHRRTIGFAEDGVWFTNEFAGARLNDVVRVAPYEYELLVAAENTPINNSAWYGFVVGRGGVPGMDGAPGLVGAQGFDDVSNSGKGAEDGLREIADSVELTLRIKYEGGGHRYQPNIMERVDSEAHYSEPHYIVRQIDSLQTSIIWLGVQNNPGLEIRVSLSQHPVLISAQRLETTHSLQDTLQTWQAQYPSVRVDTAGLSSDGRPIPGLTISHDTTVKRPTLMVIGRQHPPEVPGYEVMRSFLRRFAANDSLANKFRENFHVIAIPMANPDGVDRGHWRHNARGVDLNRDWINFNQQETQVARRYFQEKATSLGQPVYAIDFHSTQIHLMYPIDAVVIEPFDTSGPVAKNWFWRAFGIDALTYEVSDLSAPAQNDKAGVIAAESLMQTLLDALD